MTPQEVSKIIHEARGLCWHVRNRTTEEQSVAHVIWRKTDTSAPYPHLECVRCGIILHLDQEINPDYTQWQHYGPMLERAIKQGWWQSFGSIFGKMKKAKCLTLLRCGLMWVSLYLHI